MMDIKENILDIQKNIRVYEQRYGRKSGSVTLLGASKGQSLEKISAAYDAGLRIFGENYLQESLKKITALTDKNIEWHFIGPIQRNKTKKIAENFHWVQSLDSIMIAKRLSEQRPAHLPPLNICIEVNISFEPSKSGVIADQVSLLAEQCLILPNLKLRGLMGLPAIKHTITEQRTELRKLKTIFDFLCKQGFALDTLSMGMSADMEAAIAEGSNLVRIGTAIFGSRN